MKRLSPFVLLVSLSACSSVVAPPAPIDAPIDAPNDAPIDAPDASDVRDVSDVSDVRDASDVSDVRDVPDVAIAPPVDAPADAGAASDASDAGDDIDVCASAVVIPDRSTEAIAQGICDEHASRGRPCHVCIQRVTQSRMPLSWMVVESPASCGCEAPVVLVQCGGVDCFAPDVVCVFPATPSDCSAVDAGVCPPGCPGCFPRTFAARCAPASRASACAPDDCGCYLRAYCPGGVGRCRGAVPTGLMIDCEGP